MAAQEKKPPVIVIAHVDHGRTSLTAAIAMTLAKSPPVILAEAPRPNEQPNAGGGEE